MPSVAQQYPLYFIGHAGASLLWQQSPESVQTRANLREIGREILDLQPRPKALVIFSGHFVSDEIRGKEVIEVNVKPKTLIEHDFVNDFHDSYAPAYEYDWEHIDAPELAREVYAELRDAGLDARRVERNLDHGVWVPAKVLFPPEAPLDIPIIQVSTYHGYDLALQYKLGDAAARLRSLGYLLVGSGMIVHSFWQRPAIDRAPVHERDALFAELLAESKRFDRAVQAAAIREKVEERKQALLALEKTSEWPNAHPTVEHFTPLLIVAAAAGDARVEVLGKEAILPGQSPTNFRLTPL
ncbi:hypothetical protein JCM3770_005343 [Rhodotorula araucariae]